MGNSSLSQEFLVERDQRIYQMRATGISSLDIADRLEVSPATVHNAIKRHLGRLNEGSLNLVEIILLDLDRIDKMQAAIFPYTQTRRITLDDGEVVIVEPDLRAIDQVLKLMQQRSKLLGLDVQRTIDLTETSNVVDVTSSLKGDTKALQTSEITSIEDESKAMLKLAMEAGIIEPEAYEAIMADEPVEAEVVTTGEDDEEENSEEDSEDS